MVSNYRFLFLNQLCSCHLKKKRGGSESGTCSMAAVSKTWFQGGFSLQSPSIQSTGYQKLWGQGGACCRIWGCQSQMDMASSGSPIHSVAAGPPATYPDPLPPPPQIQPGSSPKSGSGWGVSLTCPPAPW